MFSHIFMSVSDFERALQFYTPLMDALGNSLRFIDRARPWAGWQSSPAPRPLLLIGAPYNGQHHDAGNGQMVAFSAHSRAVVERVHQLALAQGGICDGPPGVRPAYHEHYYAAYFKDPDGNKCCVVCHAAVAP